jgi:hypothetical protein
MFTKLARDQIGDVQLLLRDLKRRFSDRTRRVTTSPYCRAFHDRADIFLSINHEINAFTVHKCTHGDSETYGKSNPYLMRAGYVEEIFVNSER